VFFLNFSFSALAGASSIGATKVGNALQFNKIASGLTRVGALADRSSFDVRGIKVGGQSLSSLTGLNIGEAQQGGREQARKDKVEKRLKRAEGLDVRENEGLKQKLNEMEIGLQELIGDNVSLIRTLDKDIEDAREALSDAGTKEAKEAAGIVLAHAKAEKEKFRKNTKNDSDQSIYELEKNLIPKQKDDIEIENKRRRISYANRSTRWWSGLSAANREARHKMIMNEPLDSGTTT